mmetsp:Transcript_33128/g.84255  ORF Transcript_33128/g.84255 Transcript_33128/m.84255 type:complete len:336 (-) Transcript_33128:32-1039(-)
MPAKRLRVEWSSDEMVDHEHFDSDSIKVPIILGDPADFIMFAVRVSKGSALIGLVPEDAVVHDMKFSDQSAPEHGFFIKITTPAVQRLQLFGQDGTCKKDSTLQMDETAKALAIRYESSPFSFSASFQGFDETPTKTDFVPLEFANPLPEGKYVPCLILGKRSAASVVCADLQKRRRVEQHAERAWTTIWERRDFTDATLTCEGRTFQVHRVVLAAASPVLAASFRSGMVEDHTRNIDIEDAASDALEQLLKFAYTGDFDVEKAVHVLPLAVRFQVKALAEQCANFVWAMLSSTNIQEVMPVLRAHREDPSVSSIWDKVVTKVSGDKEMVRMLLE